MHKVSREVDKDKYVHNWCHALYMEFVSQEIFMHLLPMEVRPNVTCDVSCYLSADCSLFLAEIHAAA